MLLIPLAKWAGSKCFVLPCPLPTSGFTNFHYIWILQLQHQWSLSGSQRHWAVSARGHQWPGTGQKGKLPPQNGKNKSCVSPVPCTDQWKDHAWVLLSPLAEPAAGSGLHCWSDDGEWIPRPWGSFALLSLGPGQCMSWEFPWDIWVQAVACIILLLGDLLPMNTTASGKCWQGSFCRRKGTCMWF